MSAAADRRCWGQRTGTTIGSRGGWCTSGRRARSRSPSRRAIAHRSSLPGHPRKFSIKWCARHLQFKFEGWVTPNGHGITWSISQRSAGTSQWGNRQNRSRTRTNSASRAEGRYPGSGAAPGSHNGTTVAPPRSASASTTVGTTPRPGNNATPRSFNTAGGLGCCSGSGADVGAGAGVGGGAGLGLVAGVALGRCCGVAGGDEVLGRVDGGLVGDHPDHHIRVPGRPRPGTPGRRTGTPDGHCRDPSPRPHQPTVPPPCADRPRTPRSPSPRSGAPTPRHPGPTTGPTPRSPRRDPHGRRSGNPGSGSLPCCAAPPRDHGARSPR